MEIKASSILASQRNCSFDLISRPMRALMIVMMTAGLTFGSVGAQSKSFGQFKAVSSAKSSHASVPAKAVSFGSFGSSKKTTDATTATATTTAAVAAPPKTAPMSALNTDVSRNAAKANAMKTYDAKNAPVKSPDTSVYGSGSSTASGGNYSGGYSSGERQQTPAPVVVYNNANSGGSGPGFWSGLMVGNLFSSRHRTVEHHYENNSPGAYGTQQPNHMPMISGETSGYDPQIAQYETPSSPWGTALLTLALIASVVVIARFLILRKRAKSAAKARRYSL